MDKLSNENRILKERFDKLEERCQRWITDEQVYLLRRIEQLEDENHRLHENYQAYQKQSEKCIGSVTDLIIKALFTQEELRKQCVNLHNVIDTVKLRRNVQQNHDHRHTTNDQSTWFHQQLMIVEENDHKPTNQPSRMYTNNSSSSRSMM
ncbi:unnamed protein product [Rotaria socialis]|uniref:Uncharacterized protein n=1 Tax=Rotaria socialis TaxID=392032 RepID=A0A817T185_9BILA|nr:unnamed protein product [Rotaria socialis]CAF3713520.1 unnamed protein product [Rotaria socialis]